MSAASEGSTDPIFSTVLELDLHCFQCNKKLQITVPQIIDLQAKPSLRRAIVQNTAHDFTCSQCKNISRIAPAFIVWDPAQQTVFAFHKDHPFPDNIDHFERLFECLKVVQPAAEIAPLVLCQTRGELLEALLTPHWMIPNLLVCL